VARLDRLARDLVIQEQILAEIRRLGGEPFSTSDAEAGFLMDDPDDPARKLIRQVLGAVSEYERSMVALRLRSGRKRKGERGGYAYGSPPFGQRAEAGELVVDEDEARVVARIRELHAAGESLRSMASALEAEGYRPKRADRWHPQSLARILARL
jgi:DNA invertase Pin-like site-specific DNA recombinase